jgi:hypothetical protein
VKKEKKKKSKRDKKCLLTVGCSDLMIPPRRQPIAEIETNDQTGVVISYPNLGMKA